MTTSFIIPFKHPTDLHLTAAEKEIICYTLTQAATVNGVEKPLSPTPDWRLGYIFKEVTHQIERTDDQELFLLSVDDNSKLELRKRNSGGAILLVSIHKAVYNGQ